MTNKQADQDFADHIRDLAQSIGPASCKRMFGGHGIFLDGLMFALIADRVLYFKADAELAEEFIALGLSPFTYHKQGKPYQMSYYEAPEDCLEDAEAMKTWGNKAYAAALRAASGKRRTR